VTGSTEDNLASDQQEYDSGSLVALEKEIISDTANEPDFYINPDPESG
jgi:hypothetical protein